MILFVVNIEYVDGVESKLSIHKWEEVAKFIDVRLDCEHNAKQVKRITICPRYTP